MIFCDFTSELLLLDPLNVKPNSDSMSYILFDDRSKSFFLPEIFSRAVLKKLVEFFGIDFRLNHPAKVFSHQGT